MSSDSAYVKQLLARLEAALALHRPEYLDELAPGLTDEELEQFELKLGLELPADFKQYLKWHDGQARDHYEGFWFNRSLSDADFMAHCRTDWNSLLSWGEFEAPNWWNPLWIPFAENGAGSGYVLDLAGCFGGKSGQIIEFWKGDTDRYTTWPSFTSWLETMAHVHELGYRNVGDSGSDPASAPSDDAIFEDTYARLNPGYPIETAATDGRGSIPLQRIEGPLPRLNFEVSDDSGFLVLVDPDAYEAFVTKDWTLAQLFDHFRQQMAERRLLIWGTGCENLWHVHVEQGCTSARGHRSAIGPISSTKSRLLLTNYESLTMAAAYSHVTLPEPHDAHQLLTLAPGDYNCRIVQSKDPDLFDDDADEEAEAPAIPDFRVELQFATKLAPVWTAVPWWNSGGY